MAKKPFNCGVGPAFEVIGGKWKAVILCELHAQPHRPGELRRRITGITEKVLIQQLREMEVDGLVMRTVFPEVPPRVEYALTPWGASLVLALEPIATWGDKYFKRKVAGRGN